MADPPPLPPSPDDEISNILAMVGTSNYDPSKELSATQPEREAFRHKFVRARRLFTSQRRTKSIVQNIATFTDVSPSISRTLRSQVYEELQLRLKRAGVRADDLPERFFSWMLPKNNANIADWNMFMNKPFFVSNQTLSSMMSMTRVTQKSPAPPPNTRVFYVRTFAFKLHELLDLIQMMFDEGIAQDNFQYAWLVQLLPMDWYDDADVPIFVRYCGTTTDRVTNRQAGDMKSDASSFFYFFLQLCNRHFPHILAATEFHELSEGSIDFELSLGRQRIANVREQALIAMFGPGTLLNTSKGGLSTEFQSDIVDDDEFSLIGSRTLSALKHYNTPFANINAIDKYTHDISNYCKSNPLSTNTARYPFNEAVRKMVYQQGLPAQVGKYTAMVSIGSDITPDAMKNLSKWYSGGFNSSQLVIDMLNNIAKCEHGMTTTTINIVKEMEDANQLPFVDMYPWPQKDAKDMKPALRMLRDYLQAVSPIICLTFSGLVSSAAVGSFQQPHGIKNSRSLHETGNLIISKYDHEPRKKDPNNVCIVIPCAHPGMIRYATDREKVGLRVINKILAIAWFAMGEAIHFSNDKTLTKREICERVISTVEAKMGPSTAFGSTFAKAKADLIALSQVSNRTAPGTLARIRKLSKDGSKDLLAAPTTTRPSERTRPTTETDVPVVRAKSIRWKRALPELYMILECDRSRGAPKSDERRAQVETLSSLSIAPLRTTKTGHSDEEFEAWALKVRKDALYYMEAAQNTEKIEDIPNLLSLFTSKTVDPDESDWTQNDVECDAASLKLSTWLNSQFVHTNDTFEDSVKRVPRIFDELLKKHEPKLHQLIRTTDEVKPEIPEWFENDGQLVEIKPPEHPLGRPTLVLKWKDGLHKYNVRDFKLPVGSVPLFTSDIRTIHFVESGVDIRDGSGRTVGTNHARDVTCPAHYLITMLQDNGDADEFFKLWEHVTGLSFDQAVWGALPSGEPSTTDATTFVIPTSFYEGRSLPYDTSNTRVSKKKKKAEELMSQLPFQTGDVGWLINRFLEVKYPSGGKVDLANPVTFPSADSVWVHLESFIRGPRYSKHPQREGVLAAIRLTRDISVGGAGKGAISYFAVLISILRPGSTEKLSEMRNFEDKRKTRTVITLGDDLPSGIVVQRREPVGDVTTTDLPDDAQDPVDSEAQVKTGAEDDEDDEEEQKRKELADQRRAAIQKPPMTRASKASSSKAKSQSGSADDDDESSGLSEPPASPVGPSVPARRLRRFIGMTPSRPSGPMGGGGKGKGKKRAKSDSEDETIVKKSR